MRRVCKEWMWHTVGAKKTFKSLKSAVFFFFPLFAFISFSFLALKSAAVVRMFRYDSEKAKEEDFAFALKANPKCLTREALSFRCNFMTSLSTNHFYSCLHLSLNPKGRCLLDTGKVFLRLTLGGMDIWQNFLDANALQPRFNLNSSSFSFPS